MAADEILVNNSGGGGGWGPAFERDPSAVLHDVREGYVSVTAAKRDYGVVVDAATMRLNEEATRALRMG
jgi:N-methylhydantoinase B